MNRLILVAFTVSMTCLYADPLRPLTDAVRDVYAPVPLDDQRLAGLLASRLRANAEGYIEHVNVSDLIGPFTEKGSDPSQAQRAADQEAPAGQAAGLFLEAAANTYEYTDDVQIKSIMNRVAQGLVAAQHPDGHLGAFAASGQWTAMDLSVHGTALLGLLSYSRVTGDDQALATARHLADLLVKHALTAIPQGSEEWGKGDLLGSMVMLYRSTSDPRYFDFCKRLVQAASSNTAPPSNSVEQRDLLLYWAGLVDLYRLTGDQSYLTPALNGWSKTREESLTLTGSPIDVQSGKGSRDSWTDSCLTVTWMRLTQELLELQGDIQYAEAIERTVFNQLLAGQDPKTGKIDSCAVLGSAKNPDMKADTCTAGEALGLSGIPLTVWGRYRDGIGINLYQPGHATVRLRRKATVQLYSETDHPDSGSVLLHIEASHDVRFALYLRVPSWTSKFTAQVGSNVLTGKPGEYLVVDREWKRGDTVKISMDIQQKTIVDPADRSLVAIQRGPQLLVAPDAGSAGSATGTASLIPYADASSYRLWMKAPGPGENSPAR